MNGNIVLRTSIWKSAGITVLNGISCAKISTKQAQISPLLYQKDISSLAINLIPSMHQFTNDVFAYLRNSACRYPLVLIIRSLEASFSTHFIVWNIFDRVILPLFDALLSMGNR